MTPEKRWRRAIVMIDSVAAGVLKVFVPRWRENEPVLIHESSVPETMRSELRPGRILIADVNADAERAEDLVFRNFEMTPEET